jgi:hypothetical protein
MSWRARVDYAAPLRRAEGAMGGVLGAHLDWKHVTQLLESAAVVQGVDLLLISPGGTVLSGPRNLDGGNPAHAHSGSPARRRPSW